MLHLGQRLRTLSINFAVNVPSANDTDTMGVDLRARATSTKYKKQHLRIILDQILL